LLRKTLERLYDPTCIESYCHNIHLVRRDVPSAANNSPLYALFSALKNTTASDPQWLDIHRSYFEDFIEMVVNDITTIHLMLCTFLPSNLQHDDPLHPGWYVSLSSLREEWRRRFAALGDAAKREGATFYENSLRFQHAASEDSYFVTDFADVGSETDVWNNIERVLVMLFMQFVDLDSRLGSQSNVRAHGRRDVADKQRQALNIVRKYTPANVRAACLVRCQRWDDAVQVLDQADASLDACMLSVMHDIWGLSPRYERKDGLSVGVGAYMIKAFLSPSFPLLPASYLGWQPSMPHATMFLFVTMALCLDSILVNRLQDLYEDHNEETEAAQYLVSGTGDQTFTACSSLTQQLLGWLLLHVFDGPEIPRESQAARAHVISDILAPILAQIGFDHALTACCDGFDAQFMYNYLHEIWKLCAGHLDSISRHNPIHLVEASEAHLQSGQFDKWAEGIMKALVFCVPEPSLCNHAAAPHLVPPTCMTHQRRAVLQAVTRHLKSMFSCSGDEVTADSADLREEKFTELSNKLDSYCQSQGSGSWFKCIAAVSQGGQGGSNECIAAVSHGGQGGGKEANYANPKLQYIFQMLAVARAFQEHADGASADHVLKIITGRPDVFNGDNRYGSTFNTVPSSSGAFRDILLPVVGFTKDNVSFFCTRDDRPDPSSVVGVGGVWFDDRRIHLHWMLPPYDHTDDSNGQCYRVPLHPALCHHGAILSPFPPLS
jgi:hypothetical protein